MRNPFSLHPHERLPSTHSSSAEIDKSDGNTSRSTLSTGSCRGGAFQTIRIILTGTTGNLGTYVLARLLSPAVSRRVHSLHLLNRDPAAASKQNSLLEQRGLPPIPSPPPFPVVFHTADFASPELGLAPDVYADLSTPPPDGSFTTLVIHNAYPVNFNNHFSSFGPAVAGVRNLIDLTLKLSPPPSTRSSSSSSSPSSSSPLSSSAAMAFVSSISVAANHGAIPGALSRVPEAEIDDWRMARMGYGQSKLVCERLIAEAGRKSGLRAGVCRVGQVAGPVGVVAATDGGQPAASTRAAMWPKQEWLPSLIASAKAMECIPADLGPMNDLVWVPVDVVAASVVELALQMTETTPSSSASGKSRFRTRGTKQTTEWWNIVNPKDTPWQTLVPAVQEALGEVLDVVPFAEWVTKLAECGKDEKCDIERNPAVKLMSFFDNLADKAVRAPRARAAAFETKGTVEKSATLAACGKVSPEWMSLWLRQWNF